MSAILAISGISSKLWFAKRRTDKSIAAEDSVVSAANAGIAEAQLAKAGEGIVDIAKEGKSGVAKSITAMDVALRDTAKTSKFLTGLGKVGRVAMDNINPMIVGGSVFTIVRSKDKKREAIIQPYAIGTMFAFEGAYKTLTGMAQTKRVNGKTVYVEREALYKKNPFISKQVAALKDACAVKKGIVKHLPKILQGFGLVGFSVAGFAIGDKIGQMCANKILGESENQRVCQNAA